MTCLDLEGILVPEIWISVAEKTGIEDLRLTTRDEPDYDALMRRRLGILERHGLGLIDIQDVVGAMEPIEGARDFVSWLRPRFQVVVLSDTFYEFARPLMERLDWPTLFCNRLKVDAGGRVVGCIMRSQDHKRQAVAALPGAELQGLRRRRFLQRHAHAGTGRPGGPLPRPRRGGPRVPRPSPFSNLRRVEVRHARSH